MANVNDLPLELIDSIFKNLQDDLYTLSHCALVQKSWSVSAQRYLFQFIRLEFPDYAGPDDPERFSELAIAYNQRNERLLETFDRKPFLASYVQFLELERLAFGHDILRWAQGHTQDVSFATTTSIVKRLDNVEVLSLRDSCWDQLSLDLREALVHVLRRPSIDTIILYSFIISSLDALASVLCQASSLSTLYIYSLTCVNRDLPSSIKHTPSSRSIQLDQLCLNDGSLDTSRSTGAFLIWLQQDSCPFRVRNLRSLDLDRKSFSDEDIAWMLRYAGDNLQKFTLREPFELNQPSTLFHARHTPNLCTLTLRGSLHPDLFRPVPWILNFFRRIQESDVQEVSLLRRLNIVSLGDMFNRTRWDEWTAVDELFTEPRFNLLEAHRSNLRMIQWVDHINLQASDAKFWKLEMEKDKRLIRVSEGWLTSCMSASFSSRESKPQWPWKNTRVSNLWSRLMTCVVEWPSPLAMEELVQNGDTEKIESIEETEGVVQGAVKNDSVSRFADEELELGVLTDCFDCVDSIEDCGRPDVGGAECSTCAAEDESPSSCEEFEVKVEVLAFEDEIAGASFMERKFKRGKQWDFGQPA
ncbi:hypothetical protein F5880DRAFT_1505680 [Lentinula raphanica]|nr:hypothetical protein F5880DRAFT_1505680 [Lentinula raphanica]